MTSGICTWTELSRPSEASAISRWTWCGIARRARLRPSDIGLQMSGRASRPLWKWTTSERRCALHSSMARCPGGRGKTTRRSRGSSGCGTHRSQFESVPVIGGGTRLRADGEWRSLVMNLRDACTNSGRGYQFHRAVFMRLIGSLDVRSVALYTRALPATTRGEEEDFLKEDIDGPTQSS